MNRGWAKPATSTWGRRSTPAEQRSLGWQDFRAYCAGRDATHPLSSLTAYGTAGSTWESGIGFSSGEAAAALTADGQFIADRPDSPALTTLRDYFDGWEKAGRPGFEALEPVLRRVGSGWIVRTVPVATMTTA